MKFCWALLLLGALIISETAVAEEDIKLTEIIVPEETNIQNEETKVMLDMAIPHNTEMDVKEKIGREGRAIRPDNMNLFGRMVNNLDEEDLEALARAIRTRERVRRRQIAGSVPTNGKKRKSSGNKNNKTKGSRNGVKRRKNNAGKRRKNNKRQKGSINRKTKRPTKEQFHVYDDVNNDDVNNDDVNNDDVNNDGVMSNNGNNNNNNVNNDNVENDDVYEEEVHRFQRGDGEPISVMIIEEDLN